MKPFISIIVPVYNAEKSLKRCVKSLINQTYSNIEIILINDGSHDSSNNICKTFVNDKRVKYFEQQNCGVSSARNLGIDKAIGEWIVFVDSDETIDGRYCQRIIENIQENTDVLFGDFYKISKRATKFITLNEKEKNVNKSQFSNFQKWILNQYYYKEDYAISTVWGKAYKKKILDEFNIRFPEGLVMGEDKIFNLYVYQNATKGQYISGLTYNYYCDSISASSRYRIEIVENYEDLLLQIKLFLKKYNLEQEFSEEYRVRIAMALMYYILLDYCHKDNPKTYEKRKNDFFQIIEKPLYKNAIENISSNTFPIRQRVLWKTIKIKNFRLIQALCYLNQKLNGR